jgi:hypothetical protein
MAVRYGRYKVHYQITNDWKAEMGKKACEAGGKPKRPFIMGINLKTRIFCDDTQVTVSELVGLPLHPVVPRLPAKRIHRTLPPSLFVDDLVGRPSPRLDVPELYDLYIDPFEAFPLNNAEHKQLLDTIDAVVKAHEKTINLDEIKQQLGNYDKAVTPCCNPPECRCDEIIV